MCLVEGSQKGTVGALVIHFPNTPKVLFFNFTYWVDEVEDRHVGQALIRSVKERTGGLL
jgi:hypothetical protein